MENKFLAILVLVTFLSCVDQYDIDSFSETQYEPYSNLGFEDGLEHWHGKANTFSNENHTPTPRRHTLPA